MVETRDTRKSIGPHVIVDQLLNSDLRPYRLPLLKHIAESGRLSVTIWHGKARTGIGAPTGHVQSSPVSVRRVENIFWPVRDHKVLWQRGALDLLRSEGSVVICTEVIHNLTVWVIALVHRLFGKRLILNGHFIRPTRNDISGRFFGLARRALHRLADVYLSYTEEGRQSLIAEGITPERVFVSQNTLDTEALMTLAAGVDDEAVDALREELNITSGQVLLYVGRLIPVKRVDVAIEVVRIMGDDTSLVIVGDGYQRRELEELSLGLPVRLVGAIYDESELASYFKMADLLVLPGRVGLTCVHGFANGLPCVTTVEGVVDQSPEYSYVNDGVNGLILPSDAPQMHADAIRHLIEHPDLLDRLVKGANEAAVSLSIGRMAQQYEQAVLKAAAGT